MKVFYAIRSGLTMQAESKWEKRFKCEDSPEVLFLCNFPASNQASNLHRHTHPYLAVRK